MVEHRDFLSLTETTRFPQTDPTICADPASVPLPPSPAALPEVAGKPSIFPLVLLPSGCDNSPRPAPALAPAPQPDPEPVSVPAPAPAPVPQPAPIMPEIPKDEKPQVSFEEFATKYRQSQRKQVQRKRLEQRLRATKVSIGVSARMIRIGNTMQRGLVEALKHDDKANFIALYHMLHDLQESCVCVSNDQYGNHYDSSDGQDAAPDADLDHSSDFFDQLSPQSQGDLLEILKLVRSNPQFLVDRLRSFSSAQLAVLTTPAAILDTSDPAFHSSTASRHQGHYAFSHNIAQSAPFKDHIYAFERTDPLSILLYNVYAAPMEPETPEAQLRVDVWSTVCAQLISVGSNRFYPLISQILSAWATGSNWKARPKFELYLMDILQTGAFLLEHVDTAVGLDFAADALDPLRTDVAEEFFASAVDDLFRVLDDPDSGFPYAVLQFAKAVLSKIDNPDIRSRFLEYLFLQWFFPKFLYSALTYPETHGLLLDFHIRKDARDRLLNQVGLRAYSQVFAALRSMHRFSILRPSIKQRVNNMLAKFEATTSSNSSPAKQSSRRNPSNFLLLSAADVNTLLDALFPQTISSFQSTPGSSIFSMDSTSISGLENDLAQNAARIRFELTDLDEPSERSKLEYPSDEYWTIFSVSRDGKDLTWSLLPVCDAGSSKESAIESDDDTQNLGLEENYEALQTAIVRLVKENHVYGSDDYDSSPRSQKPSSQSLKQRFNHAMASATNDSDFVGAHYWWNVSRQLKQGQGRLSSSPDMADDSWILRPMHNMYIRSLSKSRVVVERCETDFISLDHSLRRVQTQVNDLMATLSKVRNKIWYMTDVKNSMRYEEAKHVAMALKNMVFPARPLVNMPEEPRSRTARSIGGSLFQKPELQVINIMKAPSSQGGPKKLSDEQVELTRKWLAHHGIENFCKGEERIHRFCYEVQTSINQLVGETMAETPVLWASELFQRERARYENYGARPFPGLSIPTTPRPSTTTSEDPMNVSQSRFPQEFPSLSRKSSIQSLLSEKWRSQREIPSIDMTSVAGSPGRAASISTSTTDTFSTFWSRPQHQPVYAGSVSSAYSQPPSMFSKTINRKPRRTDRKSQGKKTEGKTAFMDNLRQTLTSLLLSDLGSPVWSCGSETDAWFTNTLDQARIRIQMQRRAAVQKFYADYDERSKQLREQRRGSGGRRSRSLDAPGLRVSLNESSCSDLPDAHREFPDSRRGSLQADNHSPFSYKAVFHRLIEVFSRHGNPFVKLNALRDLRSLVIASLIPSQETSSEHIRPVSPEVNRARSTNMRPAQRAARNSFSEPHLPNVHPMDLGASISPPKSVTCGSRPSDHSTPSEDKIVATLRDLILEVKPKTLFRDLQFISAFIPAEQLSQGDQGTAFLQFGLAALSLKDEVCHSMVEIADRIVSQELMRRHPLPGPDFYPKSGTGHTIEDAAAMWIITAKEGNPVAQRELAILYLTHPEILPRVTLPLTRPRDTFKAEMMYMRGKDSKSDPQSMCLALHWMQLSASGGDILARNRLREREEFDSIA